MVKYLGSTCVRFQIKKDVQLAVSYCQHCLYLTNETTELI